MSESLVSTRFLSHFTLEDGSLVLLNSRTGAIGMVSPDQAPEARRALKRSARHRAPLGGILRDLADGDFLVPEGTDERELVHQQYLAKYDDSYLNLIIMPTEHCNFRCAYCYQEFVHGPMSAEIQEAVRRYVAQQPGLKRLEISWFGGEPLAAPEVVRDLTRHFHSYCAQHDLQYTASMTTNGSLLTPEVADDIIPHGVRRFQITIDGVREEHNKRRMLAGGGDTFDAILQNLRCLHAGDHSFHVVIRHNFDPDSVARLPEFIAMLKDEFGGDPRFTLLFGPIGKWGGANDRDLSTCDWRTATQNMIRAKELALEAGFRSGVQVDQLRPNGFVCYAANPRSFVIGPDGRVYKCTVELDYHDRNIVGRLHADGTMDLDWRKMALWCETNGLDDGKKCSTCFFSPTCHGAVCPKEWMDQNDCTCPSERIAIRDSLRLFARESQLPPPPAVAAGGDCVRS